VKKSLKIDQHYVKLQTYKSVPKFLGNPVGWESKGQWSRVPTGTVVGHAASTTGIMNDLIQTTSLFESLKLLRYKNVNSLTLAKNWF